MKTFLAFSCVHRPLHDPEGVAWLVNQIVERQPNYVVNLGDTFDAQCLSKFDQSTEFTLTEEYESTNEFLQQIRAAYPRAKRVWMEGNHEQRIRRAEWSKLSRELDYRSRIREARYWQHFEYRQHPDACFKLGQVTFYHGFACGRNNAKSESIKLGVPYGLTVSGHTHRPHPVHRISMGVTPLPYWHVNAGTFIKADVEYMQQKDTSLWGGGCVFGSVDPSVRHDGKQRWEAEFVSWRMNWSESEMTAV